MIFESDRRRDKTSLEEETVESGVVFSEKLTEIRAALESDTVKLLTLAELNARKKGCIAILILYLVFGTYTGAAVANVLEALPLPDSDWKDFLLARKPTELVMILLDMAEIIDWDMPMEEGIEEIREAAGFPPTPEEKFDLK